MTHLQHMMLLSLFVYVVTFGVLCSLQLLEGSHFVASALHKWQQQTTAHAAGRFNSQLCAFT